MTQRPRYQLEVRERAVRPVLEHTGESPSKWAAITSIAAKCGMTRRRCASGCGGLRSTPAEAGPDDGRAQAPAELERENRELRRANEILKSAASFFARELDLRLPR